MQTIENKPSSPWIEIWAHPRNMLRKMLEKDPKRWIVLLAILNGLVAGFAWWAALWAKHVETVLYKSPLFVVALLVGAVIMSILSLFVSSWLYRLTGKWLGGKGNFTEVKCAVGWSYYPYLVANLFGILNSLTLSTPFVGLFFGLISIVLMVWGFIIFLKLLGEAHQFSAWRALACLFIAAVLIFIVVMLLIFLIPVLKPLFAS